jgi:hypothetical protein
MSFLQGHSQVTFKCWSGGCSGVEIIRALTNTPALRIEREEGFHQARGNPHFGKADHTDDTDTAKRNLEVARRLWREASSPYGTIVQSYLRSRDLDLDAEFADRTIRFHGRLFLQDHSRHYGGMVALVRDVGSGAPIGIVRTYLNPDGSALLDADGRKIKLALGRTKRGAIMFDRFSSITTAGSLTIGEGIESTLSAFFGLPLRGALTQLRPCWALLSAVGVAKLPVLPAVNRLIILSEHDTVGARAGKEAEGRWKKAGREALFYLFNAQLKDANDLRQAWLRRHRVGGSPSR